MWIELKFPLKFDFPKCIEKASVRKQNDVILLPPTSLQK